VSALKKRVSELEQSQHDMAAVVAALQQQLGQIQAQLAAKAQAA
jgi:prefoldin subunit 5